MSQLVRDNTSESDKSTNDSSTATNDKRWSNIFEKFIEIDKKYLISSNSNDQEQWNIDEWSTEAEIESAKQVVLNQYDTSENIIKLSTKSLSEELLNRISFANKSIAKLYTMYGNNNSSNITTLLDNRQHIVEKQMLSDQIVKFKHEIIKLKCELKKSLKKFHKIERKLLMKSNVNINELLRTDSDVSDNEDQKVVHGKETLTSSVNVMESGSTGKI